MSTIVDRCLHACRAYNHKSHNMTQSKWFANVCFVSHNEAQTKLTNVDCEERQCVLYIDKLQNNYLVHFFYKKTSNFK